MNGERETHFVSCKTIYISEFSVIVAFLDDRFDNRPVRESPRKTFPRAPRAVRPTKIVKIRILIPHISLFRFKSGLLAPVVRVQRSWRIIQSLQWFSEY